jgi:hypothetical protein
MKNIISLITRLYTISFYSQETVSTAEIAVTSIKYTLGSAQEIETFNWVDLNSF